MRELTKKFEEVVRFRADCSDWMDALTLKGEFVLLYHCEKKPLYRDPKVVELAKDVLEKNSSKNLARLLGKILDTDSKEIYRQLARR